MTDQNDDKALREASLEKTRMEVRKMLADIEHDSEQRNHWKAQRLFWGIVGAVAIATVVFTNILAAIKLITAS